MSPCAGERRADGRRRALCWRLSAPQLLSGALLGVLGAGGLAAQTCGSASDRLPVLEGIVRDREVGVPLVGARVRAEWAVGAPGGEQSVTTRTDADGRFALCRPVERVSIRVRARVGDWSSPERVVRLYGPTVSPQRIEFEVPLGNPDAYSGLFGWVADEGERPVPGADVRLEGLRAGRITARDGAFVFDRVRAGSYVLRVEHIAHAAFVDTVHLAPGRPLQVRIPVATVPIPVEGIEVTVRNIPWLRRRSDLYGRMSRGIGHFITRTQIVDRGSPPVSSLLRSVPGVNIERVYVAGRHVFYPVIRGAGIPALYVDGARVSLEPGLGYGIDVFLSNEIDVIEVYSGPASAPIGLPSSCSACGVIHIWTRAP